MKRVLLTLVFALVLMPAIGDAAKPILNLVDVAVPMKLDSTSHTAEEVQKAIVGACFSRGWAPVLDGEGMIRATINVRGKHFAEIEIPFSASRYSILYKNSKNLDWDPKSGKIHRNYNNWVVKLSASIDQLIRESN